MGYIAVDLDATLAYYSGFGDGSIGKPIPKMVDRVKKWLKEGKTVKIFTARISPISAKANGLSVEEVKKPIEDWCKEHIGVILPITCEKDFGMIELWDDRCVQVLANTGMRADGKE